MSASDYPMSLNNYLIHCYLCDPLSKLTQGINITVPTIDDIILLLLLSFACSKICSMLMTVRHAQGLSHQRSFISCFRYTGPVGTSIGQFLD